MYAGTDTWGHGTAEIFMANGKYYETAASSVSMLIC